MSEYHKSTKGGVLHNAIIMPPPGVTAVLGLTLIGAFLVRARNHSSSSRPAAPLPRGQAAELGSQPIPACTPALSSGDTPGLRGWFLALALVVVTWYALGTPAAMLLLRLLAFLAGVSPGRCWPDLQVR